MSTMVKVILHTADNVPENYVNNQFCIGHDEPGAVDPDAVVVALKAFYDDLAGVVLSDVFAATGHEMKFYDLPGTPPNYPYAERTWDFTSAPTGATLPSECAIVLSFQGSRAAGFPQARRRGRIFIGPLKSAINLNGRPNPSTLSAIATFAEDLQTALLVSPSEYWAVWSTVDQEAVQIQNGWVDNAFDTQRRRGLERTSRVLFP